MPDTVRRRIVVEVPWSTLLKLITVVILVWVWLQITDIVLLLVVAVLLAITLNPAVEWIRQRGLPRWAAATLVTFVLFGSIAGFLWLTWSSLSSQAAMLGSHLRDFEQTAFAYIPAPFRSAFGMNAADAAGFFGPYALRLVHGLGTAIIVFALAFVLTLYLLIEEENTSDWLLAFVPQGRRAKVEATLDECQRVVFAYVAGNLATSLFATVFVGIALSVLKVPAALLLAVFAGVFDFVPVIGFICSAAPAVLLALTVSSSTATTVLFLYVAYHAIENYLIAPRVYGGQLKLSNVAVVLAFAIGAAVAGVVGALIALPLAAMYPTIERIWLRDQLAAGVVQEHRAIERRSA